MDGDMRENAKKVAELLKALANENRLLILCALTDGAKTVGELSRFVPGITQGALSQHLSLLKAHGILDKTKSGQSVTYFIADTRVGEILKTLKTYYCAPEEWGNPGTARNGAPF
jgi:DNA-binding transcriptional ArsR family regulator